MKNLEKGEYVEWKEVDGDTARGRVMAVFIEEFTRTIDGVEYHKTPDIDNPAYLVEMDNGKQLILSDYTLTESEDQDQPVIRDTITRTKEKGKLNK